MSVDEVRAWLGRLRTLDAATLHTGLSATGAREAWKVALDALTDEALAQAAALPVRPAADAAILPASTVFTAPLEWCAVLLGRGTRVQIKRPRARSGLIDAMVQRAGSLPLRATDDRGIAGRAELVVAMGSDETLAAIRAALRPGARFAGHGHAWSLAWITGDRWDEVAYDAMLHDSRGCLSPAAILTPTPLQEAIEALGEAMARAQSRWPRGEVDPAEGARIRSRRALARVLGAVAEGEGWAVHGLPADQATPAALPRVPVVVSVPDVHEAVAWARRWPALSTVGTDASPEPWRGLARSRICAPGEMQRPPLRRLHDGVDWVAEETGWPQGA